MTCNRFTGKRALITGGASGIGRATAERLSAEGANLILADYDIEGAQRAAQEISQRHGVRVETVKFDAASASSCKSMVDTAAACFDGIDILCNIAGIMDWGGFCEFSEDAWERMLKIDLSSVFYVSQRAMPHLIKSRGNILSVSSASALIGIPYIAAYASAKAGVIALTKSMAVEFASQGVRVNAVCPGGVKTPMHDKSNTNPVGIAPDMMQKIGERHWPKLGDLCAPEDIAAAIAYLCSDEARYVTGIAHIVDGGQLAG